MKKYCIVSSDSNPVNSGNILKFAFSLFIAVFCLSAKATDRLIIVAPDAEIPEEYSSLPSFRIPATSVVNKATYPIEGLGNVKVTTKKYDNKLYIGLYSSNPFVIELDKKLLPTGNITGYTLKFAHKGSTSETIQSTKFSIGTIQDNVMTGIPLKPNEQNFQLPFNCPVNESSAIYIEYIIIDYEGGIDTPVWEVPFKESYSLSPGDELDLKALAGPDSPNLTFTLEENIPSAVIEDGLLKTIKSFTVHYSSPIVAGKWQATNGCFMINLEGSHSGGDNSTQSELAIPQGDICPTENLTLAESGITFSLNNIPTDIDSDNDDYYFYLDNENNRFNFADLQNPTVFVKPGVTDENTIGHAVPYNVVFVHSRENDGVTRAVSTTGKALFQPALEYSVNTDGIFTITLKKKNGSPATIYYSLNGDQNEYMSALENVRQTDIIRYWAEYFDSEVNKTIKSPVVEIRFENGTIVSTALICTDRNEKIEWYSIDGHHLDKMPQDPGLYIKQTSEGATKLMLR
ncbi:MAG: hypothetical protein NC201_00295 [Prevotella sp.]|nr:hypothetical protein [Bacteroides sp.]MCM1365667.1 hypothetical protein [Prevotella sp.]